MASNTRLFEPTRSINVARGTCEPLITSISMKSSARIRRLEVPREPPEAAGDADHDLTARVFREKAEPVEQKVAQSQPPRRRRPKLAFGEQCGDGAQRKQDLDGKRGPEVRLPDGLVC